MDPPTPKSPWETTREPRERVAQTSGLGAKPPAAKIGRYNFCSYYRYLRRRIDTNAEFMKKRTLKGMRYTA